MLSCLPENHRRCFTCSLSRNIYSRHSLEKGLFISLQNTPVIYITVLYSFITMFQPLYVCMMPVRNGMKIQSVIFPEFVVSSVPGCTNNTKTERRLYMSRYMYRERYTYREWYLHIRKDIIRAAVRQEVWRHEKILGQPSPVPTPWGNPWNKWLQRTLLYIKDE